MRCWKRTRLRVLITVLCILPFAFLMFALDRTQFNGYVYHRFNPLRSLFKGQNRTSSLYEAEHVNLRFLEGSFSSYFVVLDSVNFNIPSNTNATFVLVIPRRINKDSLNVYNRSDERSARIAGSMLNALNELDGIACLPRSSRKYLEDRNDFSSKEHWKRSFNSTWCNFLKRGWSIQIRNSGNISAYDFELLEGLTNKLPGAGSVSMIQMCNLVNGPFVLRKETFVKLGGLKANFGRTTLLDFFIRSGGGLKIGKSADCFYSDELFSSDRGNLEGTGDFPDYSNFGAAHNVLRIIMEDRIEWTKCVATDKLCKEIPYNGPPSTFPEIGQPICCSVMLGQMLKDIVKVLNKLGIKYRLLYGTLLGGERSHAIIPYTYDFDLTLEYKYSKNRDSYATLQKYFGNKYFISGYSFINFPRLLPLYPVHINIATGPFFKDEYDLQGEDFFSLAINKSIGGFLPFAPTNWRSRSYTDFYPGEDSFWDGSSTTFINGVGYDTVKRKDYELANWYGNNWRTPILKEFKSQSDEGQLCC